jgi:hypothetical protein
LGKVFSQSEKILDRKREAYKDFLNFCPSPNEAHLDTEVDITEIQRKIGVLTLYASLESTQFAAKYFGDFASAQEVLRDIVDPGHPEFIKVVTSYNRMVWAMRNDAMTWSIFAPKKSAREYKPSIGLD